MPFNTIYVFKKHKKHARIPGFIDIYWRQKTMEKTPLAAHSAFHSASNKLKGFKRHFWLLVMITGFALFAIDRIHSLFKLEPILTKEKLAAYLILTMITLYLKKLISILPLSLTLNYVKGQKAHWKNIHPMNDPKTWRTIILLISLIILASLALALILLLCFSPSFSLIEQIQHVTSAKQIFSFLKQSLGLSFLISMGLFYSFIFLPILGFSLLQILEGQGVTESIKTGALLWNSKKINCIIYILYSFLLILLSLCTLGIALIWTLPLLNLYTVEFYLSCKKNLELHQISSTQ